MRARLSSSRLRWGLILVVVFAVISAAAWGYTRYSAAARILTLSDSDRSSIRQRVAQHTSLPLRSMASMPGGTVAVFVGENTLGGMQFVAVKVDGEWRISGQTLFY